MPQSLYDKVSRLRPQIAEIRGDPPGNKVGGPLYPPVWKAPSVGSKGVHWVLCPPSVGGRFAGRLSPVCPVERRAGGTPTPPFFLLKKLRPAGGRDACPTEIPAGRGARPTGVGTSGAPYSWISASISTAINSAVSLPLLTQAWLVPCCTTTSNGFRSRSSSSSNSVTSPDSRTT